MKILLSPKFQIQKSYWLVAVFLFIHIGSIFCICFIDLILWLKIALAIGILINLDTVIRNHALRNSSQAVIEFWQNSNGECFLKKRAGEIIPASLTFPAFVSNYLIVLNFIAEKKFSKINVLITKDTFLAKDDFRKLKVSLITKP
jgi:hypothetical protein